MYWTYLRRELSGRTKQTIIVASGLAIAIALVIVVNALSAGVRDAQSAALESVYGVGTDLTVSGAATQPGERDGGGPRFEFGADAGQTDDGTTEISQSVLSVERFRSTLEESSVGAVAAIDGVAAASGALSLTNTSFSGELPDPTQQSAQDGAPGGGQGGPREGGFDGAGGSAFDVDSFTVLGIDPGADAVGPLSAVTLADGRGLDSDDVAAAVAVIDSAYATSNELVVGDTLDVGGEDFEIVGIVSSTSTSADTAANVYIPLGVAQQLAGLEEVVSTVYVQADSAVSLDTVQTAIETELPDATVSSQSDLAATVSGSLASASSLITSLGTWLSIIVLAVALVMAVLFTVSGVTRRTREFGTLKAIGWSDRRVVGQVAGESMVQGLLGGAVGLALGLAGIAIVNAIAPTISSAPAAQTAGPGGGTGGPGGGFGGPGGAFAGVSETSAEIVLNAPITPWIVVAAIGLAVVGGVVAGAFGGWRASRLSPAEALRAVA
ncbi:ABC transporter permease [Microbacterium awajiense]|uniref:ABC transporter permease n=1 Tax=Microbacterium awajiense TaxID=415214 RepID=A0ABP7AC29_9MICO